MFNCGMSLILDSFTLVIQHDHYFEQLQPEKRHIFSILIYFFTPHHLLEEVNFQYYQIDREEASKLYCLYPQKVQHFFFVKKAILAFPFMKNSFAGLPICLIWNNYFPIKCCALPFRQFQMVATFLFLVRFLSEITYLCISNDNKIFVALISFVLCGSQIKQFIFGTEGVDALTEIKWYEKVTCVPTHSSV